MPPELIILFISAGAVVFGALFQQKGDHLLKNGKKAVGVVYKNNFSPHQDGGGTYRPVVRFLTDKEIWITQELSTGYSPAIPEGTKIEVIYDPEQPSTVEVYSTMLLRIVPQILILSGVLGFAFGALEYLEVINLIPDSVAK